MRSKSSQALRRDDDAFRPPQWDVRQQSGGSSLDTSIQATSFRHSHSSAGSFGELVDSPVGKPPAIASLRWLHFGVEHSAQNVGVSDSHPLERVELKVATLDIRKKSSPVVTPDLEADSDFGKLGGEHLGDSSR